MSIHRVVTLADEEGFQKVIVAPDRLSIAQRIQLTVQDPSKVGILGCGIEKLEIRFPLLMFYSC